MSRNWSALKPLFSAISRAVLPLSEQESRGQNLAFPRLSGRNSAILARNCRRLARDARPHFRGSETVRQNKRRGHARSPQKRTKEINTLHRAKTVVTPLLKRLIRHAVSRFGQASDELSDAARHFLRTQHRQALVQQYLYRCNLCRRELCLYGPVGASYSLQSSGDKSARKSATLLRALKLSPS